MFVHNVCIAIQNIFQDLRDRKICQPGKRGDFFFNELQVFDDEFKLLGHASKPGTFVLQLGGELLMAA